MIEVEHHSEFLARHAARIPAAASESKLVFHDPCYLGRYRGIFEEPRKTIEKFGRLVEPQRTRERSFCCGAGGGLVFLGEESGQRIGERRAAELAATGAERVVTACPFCATMLRDAVNSHGQTRLVDIAQLAAEAIRKPA